MATESASTRDRIVAAAFETLRTRGMGGASARAIASEAGVNAGLIYHYFESIDDVLIEALRVSSDARFERHREAIDAADTPAAMVSGLRAIYAEDLATGHIRVVCEMVAGSVSRPELGARVMELVEPWIELAERTVERVLAGSPLAQFAPPRQVALAGVTFYLGANLMTQLSQGAEPVDELFDSAEQAAALLALLPSTD